MQTGSDARLCSVDAGQWCTIAEGAAAFLLTFLWALYGFPFALVLTLPGALLVGRLAPMLEREFDVSRIRLVQYSLGTGIGVAVAMLLELATDGKVSLRVVVAGLLAGAAGVFAFRRARYPLSDILISE